MADRNPYAPPEDDRREAADSGGRWGDSEGGLWQDRGLLVVDDGAELPPRCIRCNAPATGRPLRRKLIWHPAGWYLLVLFNLLLYAIVAMIVRKTATIHVGLCDRHRNRRGTWIVVASVLLAAAFVVPLCLIPLGGDAVFAAGLLILPLLLAAGLCGIFGARVVYAKKIDGGRAWVGGACPDYLSGLPEWNGA